MNLHQDIEKATMIPNNTGNAKFVRLKGPSQATRDKMINERHLKPPKNMQLIDLYEPDTFDDVNTELCFNEHEIASSIRTVNGGMTYSNEDMECYLRLRQEQNAHERESSDRTLSSNDSNLSSINDTVVETVQNDENIHESKSVDQMKKNLDEKMDILRKCGLSRNAAIGGLFMQDKISIHDLMPLETQDPSDNSNKGNDESNKINLVPLPEDPEVFVQPWQAYGKLDPDKSRGIDFTVDRIGKKKIVTARQFLISEEDDSSFVFVKKTHK